MCSLIDCSPVIATRRSESVLFWAHRYTCLSVAYQIRLAQSAGDPQEAKNETSTSNCTILGRDVLGKEREKTGTGKKLERTLFFPFPFLYIFDDLFFLVFGKNRQKRLKKRLERRKKAGKMWNGKERPFHTVPNCVAGVPTRRSLARRPPAAAGMATRLSDNLQTLAPALRFHLQASSKRTYAYTTRSHRTPLVGVQSQGIQNDKFTRTDATMQALVSRRERTTIIQGGYNI